MLASVTGVVEYLGLDSCVVDVGGIGYRIMATPATLAGLRTGTQAHLATTLVVREDSLTLYGFADADSRDTFETLQTVSGVGPRLALAMLAVHTPDDLRRAISGEDVKALTQVPGVGPKGARRIILEIGERLGPAPAAPNSAIPSSVRSDVLAALVGLGWPAKNGEAAVDAVLEEEPEATSAAVLKSALQLLGRNKRG